MELTSKALREAEFREKRGGYHPEDVDRLLEEVAEAVDVLHDRLRQAVDRAQKAEAAAANSGGSDEALRRTLVLAQRTADMAVAEAREQAAHIVSQAEQQANALLADAEERARKAHDEAISEIRTDLISLEAVRHRGQQEVDVLNRWVEEHRSHLVTVLKDALGVVERAGTLSPAPISHPIEIASRPQAEHARSGPSAKRPVDAPDAHPVESHPSDTHPGDNHPSDNHPGNHPGGGTALAGPVGQPTVAWSAPEFSHPQEARQSPFDAPSHQQHNPSHQDKTLLEDDALHQENTLHQDDTLHQDNATEANGRGIGEVVDAGAPTLDPDEQAMDDFFDGDELDDEERRFGGRLRRRR